MDVLAHTRKAKRRVGWRALLLWLLLAPTPATWADSSNRPEKETQLKALILYQIPKLITWNVRISRNAKDFRYCVLDDPYFATVLGAVVAGKRYQGRDIHVSEFDKNNPDVSCRVLYVAHDSAFTRKTRDQALILLRRLADQGVLIIGGAANILKMAGHIKLESHRNRVALKVSRAGLESPYFKIGARLVALSNIAN